MQTAAAACAARSAAIATSEPLRMHQQVIQNQAPGKRQSKDESGSTPQVANVPCSLGANGGIGSGSTEASLSEEPDEDRADSEKVQKQ